MAAALFVGYVSVAVAAVVVLAVHGSAARKRALPFGPFLAGGGILALFAGAGLLDFLT